MQRLLACNDYDASPANARRSNQVTDANLSPARHQHPLLHRVSNELQPSINIIIIIIIVIRRRPSAYSSSQCQRVGRRLSPMLSRASLTSFSIHHRRRRAERSTTNRPL